MNPIGPIGHAVLFGGLYLISQLGIDQAAANEKGFEKIFNGKDLTGWRLVNKTKKKTSLGYVVEDGVLVCPKAGGGNLVTTKEYSDFIFRFEYRLAPGGNNGVGIRAPKEGNPAYQGMEIQIIDDYAEKYAARLRPVQYHGSIYDVVAAKHGAPKPAGQWNTEEISCIGRQVKVTVNGQVIVDANLDDVTDPKVLAKHPGLSRERGHIGFLGHGSRVEFRNIRIKEVSKNE